MLTSKTILITGGAGYIGSHTGFLLSKLGYKIIIIDKLLHGQHFPHKWATLIKGDFSDPKILKNIFESFNIKAVMHFAAFIEVGESVKNPIEFYENNVSKTLKLLNSCVEHNVKKFIFSSSCAVYGNPIQMPMNEKHPLNPVSPYGKNKLTIEFALQDYDKAYGLKFISLRYFNAAGAYPEEGLGEQHNPETHIIPLILRAIKNKKTFKIFGTDYNTKDGTALRDYIHVLDIAQAHVLALKYLETKTKGTFNVSDVFNLGTGNGYTVKEMINAAEKICGNKLQVEICGRRAGDPDKLLADPKKIRNILGWKPKYSDLNNILMTAWLWEKKNIFLSQYHLNKKQNYFL